MATLDLAGRGYYSGATGTIATRGIREARATVIRSAVVAYESIRVTPLVQVDASARARDIASAGYYGGVSTIIATAGFRSPQQSIAADFVLDLSAVKAINSDHTALFDILANVGLVSRNVDFYYDAVSAVTHSGTVPFDILSAVERDTPSAFDARSAVLADATAPYEGNRLILAQVVIPLETAGLWGATVFIHAAGAVHFRFAPLRPGQTGIALKQPMGRDTSGEPYVYTKSVNKQRTHALMFRIPKLELDALLYFHGTAVLGDKRTWTWYDQDNKQHTVRFIDKRIPWKRLGPDRYETTVQLREDLPL